MGNRRGRGRGGGDGNGSGNSGSVRLLEFAEDRFGNESFLIAENSMIANSGNTKQPKGIQLGRARRKSRQVRRRVQGVDVEGVLKVRGEGVEILSDKVQTP